MTVEAAATTPSAELDTTRTRLRSAYTTNAAYPATLTQHGMPQIPHVARPQCGASVSSAPQIYFAWGCFEENLSGHAGVDRWGPSSSSTRTGEGLECASGSRLGSKATNSARWHQPCARPASTGIGRGGAPPGLGLWMVLNSRLAICSVITEVRYRKLGQATK